MNTLTTVIHADSGVGKSDLLDTSLAPRLVLDAEGGSQFTPSQPKMIWNPRQYAPPGIEGCEPGQEELAPTTRVLVRDFDTISSVYQWLNSGQHRFASTNLDSVTEIQKRCLDDVAGTNSPTTQNWGTLLAKMEGLVRSFRDLTMHPTNPLQQVNFACLSKTIDGVRRPFVKGQLQDTLPGFVDVVGYLYTKVSEETGLLVRELLVQPFPGFVAKDRTNRLGSVFPIPSHNEDGTAGLLNGEPAMEAMMTTIFGSTEA